MTTPLNPGDFTADPLDNTKFDDSLADLMDRELDRLLRLDTPDTGLLFTPGDLDVRARRRLFVAIARGVLLYLARNNDAIDITVHALDDSVNPVIQVIGA
jgi:hypothetical protein